MAVGSLNFKDLRQHAADHCAACSLSKIDATPHASTSTVSEHALHPLQTLHADLCALGVTARGVTARGAYRYFLVVVDGFSGFVEVALIRQKSEVPEALIRIIHSLEKQSGQAVKRLHSDMGGEFTSSHLQSFLTSKDIAWTFPPPLGRIVEARRKDDLMDAYIAGWLQSKSVAPQDPPVQTLKFWDAHFQRHPRCIANGKSRKDRAAMQRAEAYRV